MEKIITNLRSNSKDNKELINFLYEVNNDFNPPLDQRVDLIAYVEKLLKNAHVICAYDNRKLFGILAIYCNNFKSRTAYIPIVAVAKEYRGMGIGRKLLETSIEHVKLFSFKSIEIETWEGSGAQKLYSKLGFQVYNKKDDRKNGIKSVNMRLILTDQTPFTPLEYLNSISSEFNSNIFIKRDDLFPFTGGGSKARKLNYIINPLILQSHNAIVTTGSNQSNHLRSTALYAARLGWKIICVIHDIEPQEYKGNLKLIQLTGAELRFVKHHEVKLAMDMAMIDLKNRGYNPFYIWGGGHCVEGAYAYYEAVRELKSQLGNIKPNYIVVASGTGTTQAGIEIGVRRFLPDCKVIGISVAREEERGKYHVRESMKELNQYLGSPVDVPDDIIFDDSWIGEGYESSYPELIQTIKSTACAEGIVLDPTYSGKAFHALKMYFQNQTIESNSTIVFWHTGGLLNLLASKEL